MPPWPDVVRDQKQGYLQENIVSSASLLVVTDQHCTHHCELLTKYQTTT